MTTQKLLFFFDMEMSDTCGHVARGLKIFEIFFGPNQRVTTKSKKGQNCTFWYFFNPPVPQVSPINTKIGTKIELHATYVNTKTNF